MSKMKKARKKNISFKKTVNICLALSLVIIIFSGLKTARAEWREPQEPPATETFSAPLTTGSEDQSKGGYLELNPFYNPSQTNSLIFGPDYPLDVKGPGIKFSVPTVYNDQLNVGSDSLFVDSVNEWVGIATSSFTPGIKVKVVDGRIQVGTEATPIDGRAVSAYGSEIGIYADAGNIATAGIYGLRNSVNGLAAVGQSANQVGVRGESVGGTGIYAITSSDAQAAVYGANSQEGWAGYFDGRVGSWSDIIAKRFLASYLQQSVLPYTSGQELGDYAISTWTTGDALTMGIAFDGTNIWLATDNDDYLGRTLFKVRPSDGATIDSFAVGNGLYDVDFDGRYLWLVGPAGSIYRFDPADNSSSLVSGLSVNMKYDLTPTSIGGAAYVWALDSVAGAVLKIKSDDLSVVVYNLGLSSAAHLGGYDGEYIWVTNNPDSMIRLWVADPADPVHPAATFDVTTASYDCQARGVIYDGLYTWCLPGGGSGSLVRFRADNLPGQADPAVYDPNFPPVSIGAAGQLVDYGASDGTYIWLYNSTASQLQRYLIADPSQVAAFTLAYVVDRMVFDGTNLWLTEPRVGAAPHVHKIFTGTGWGKTDFNTSVNLQSLVGKCSITAAQQCLYDWHCPATETCTAENPVQPGNFSISKSAEVKNGYCHSTDNSGTYFYDRACANDSNCTDLTGGQCLGGNTNVSGDVSVVGNQWGGNDETINVSGGLADCPEGYFIKSLTINSSSEIESIVCRGL